MGAPFKGSFTGLSSPSRGTCISKASGTPIGNFTGTRGPGKRTSPTTHWLCGKVAATLAIRVYGFRGWEKFIEIQALDRS